MEDTRKRNISKYLRELRGERKQGEVAKAVGVTAMAISQYETGKRIPNDTVKERLAKYYGTTVEAIFYTN